MTFQALQATSTTSLTSDPTYVPVGTDSAEYNKWLSLQGTSDGEDYADDQSEFLADAGISDANGEHGAYRA